MRAVLLGALLALGLAPATAMAQACDRACLTGFLDRYFEAFLAFFFPQAHADIDWARRYEMLDKEFQQIVREAEQGRRVVDKLVKVWLKSGEERWILIHVEV